MLMTACVNCFKRNKNEIKIEGTNKDDDEVKTMNSSTLTKLINNNHCESLINKEKFNCEKNLYSTIVRENKITLIMFVWNLHDRMPSDYNYKQLFQITHYNYINKSILILIAHFLTNCYKNWNKHRYGRDKKTLNLV